MAIILNGKTLATAVENLAQWRAQEVEKTLGRKPQLCIVSIGENEASEVYMRNKKRAAERCNVDCRVISFGQNVGAMEVRKWLENASHNPDIDGVIVQLPAGNLDERELVDAISPLQDVDGFTRSSIASLYLNERQFEPCTPAGIMALLSHYNIPIDGRHAVIVGRSNIVGKPLAALLLNSNATVTVCHSHTTNLAAICRTADILISAVGKPHLITEDYVQDGATVIDVGINRVNGKLCGDVDYDNVVDKVCAITPVPGGVGPMTVAMLMRNTVNAAYNKIRKE